MCLPHTDTDIKTNNKINEKDSPFILFKEK